MITGKKIMQLLGEKNQIKFLNTIFEPLKLEGFFDAISSWPLLGKQRRYALMNGKEANSHSTLATWSEIIRNANIYDQLIEKIAVYQSDNEEQRRAFRRMFEEDKSDKHMPRKLAAKIGRKFDQNEDCEAILLLFLWAIFREDISLLSFLYTNEEKQASPIPAVAEEAQLRPHMIPANPIYIRHSSLIQEIHNKLIQRNHFVFLQGMGGVGKTESAKQYAMHFSAQYDTIVFAEYNSSLQDLLNDNTVFTLTKPFQSERFRNLDGMTETDEEFYQRKLEVIRRAVNDRTLLILDNVDTQDSKLEDFLTGICHVIVTTRWQSQTVYPENTISLDEINNPQECKEIFSAYYGTDVQDDPYVEKIIAYYAGHTLALELTAKQMKASLLSAGDMWKIIQSQSEGELEEGFVLPNKGRGVRSMTSHIQQIFNITNLNETSRYILCCVSLMPKSGLHKKNVRDFCGRKSYSEINDLVNRSWLRELNGIITMHTLIKETVQIVFQPTLQSCMPFIEKMTDEYSSVRCYWAEYDKKIEIYKIAAHLYDLFPAICLEASNIYEWIELVFSHCFQSQKAFQVAHELYLLYCKELGDNSFKAIRMLCRMGCDTRHFDGLEKAYDLLSRGARELIALSDKDDRQFMYLSDVDLVISGILLQIYIDDRDEGRLVIAEAVCKEAIQIRSRLREHCDYEYNLKHKNCVYFYVDLARIALFRGADRDAVGYMQCADKEFCENGMGYDLYYLDVGKAELAMALKQTDEAICYWEEALSCRKDYFGNWITGDTTVHVIDTRINLGKAYKIIGAYKKALEVWLGVLEDVKSIPFYQNKCQLITELINGIKQESE